MSIITDKLKLYGLAGVIGLLLVVVIWGAVGKWSTDKEMARLRNEAASKDQTLEVQKGLYTKLSLESDDLKSLLNSKDVQIQELLSQVKKSKEDLLTANQLVVQWKKAYEGAANANQTHVDPVDPGKPGRDKVTFDKDFGMIGVKGYTLTNPPEAWVSVNQLKPLKITVAVTQDANKQWHSYATSSDENTTVDIALASVNPYVLEPKWYEKLQLNATLAGGSSGDGFGILAGIGVGYKIKQFDIGPSVFVGISTKVAPYFGAQFSWRPFER